MKFWLAFRQVALPAAGTLFFAVGAFVIIKYWDQFPWPDPPVATITPTVTSPPDVGSEAVTTAEADCFDWSYVALARIEADEVVRVLGRNQDASWYMVRWRGLTAACWVEAELLKPRNFEPYELFHIKNPFPPPATSTPEPGSTSRATPVPTLTETPYVPTGLPWTATPLPTRTPRTVTPVLTDMATDTATASPSPTATPTQTPTDTPTNTPTNTPTPTKTICPTPAAPELSLNLLGQNVDLTWPAVPNALRYKVFRAVENSGYSPLVTITGTAYRDSLRPHVTHSYYVVASNGCGDGPKSSTKEVSR